MVKRTELWVKHIQIVINNKRQLFLIIVYNYEQTKIFYYL